MLSPRLPQVLAMIAASAAILTPLSAARSAHAQDIGRFDVSGADGQRGRDGSSGSSGGYGGGDGGNGGDAGRATRGQDAGMIDVQLGMGKGKGGAFNGTVVIRGQLRTADGERGGVSRGIVIGDSGYLVFDAHGGKGGDGGNGGDGGDGGRGSDGSDATRYSSGTSGGRGGDGGNGGDATSGEDGGDGGRITLTVRADEAGLLMLPEAYVGGGDGGAPGRNGSGGSGGSGGRGGSSYSWTEEDCHYETEYYTDSDGKSQSRSVQKCTTIYKSNPGGSDGSSGSSGSSGNASVSHGSSGRDGTYRIRVVHPNGSVSTYASRYDLHLDGFELRDEQSDGVLEPGERVKVSRIRVRNTGGMPTPTHQKIRIYLKDRSWVLSDGVNLDIPKSLAPGETYTFEKDALTFAVRDTQVSRPGDRFVAEDTVTPLAAMREIERPFTEFDHSRAITITYPIEITPVRMRRSVEPGGLTTVIWQVRNISRRDFSQADIKRVVATELKYVNGAMSPDDFTFTNAQGEEVRLDQGFLAAVDGLKAGESRLIRGTIQLKTTVQAYTNTRLRVGLRVGELHDPAKPKLIQFRDITIRVAETYFKSKDSSLLLVTNNRTTQEELRAWQRLAAEMRVGLDIWDISYYGFLDLAAALERSGSSLVKDFAGKTMILLNNSFDPATGASRPAHYLSKQDFVQAASRYGIRFYIPGETEGLDIGRYSLPTQFAASGAGSKFSSIEAFLADLRDAGRTRGRGKSKVAVADPADPYGQVAQVSVKSGFALSQPGEDDLRRRAEALQKDLIRLHPDRRYVVSYRHEPGKLGFGSYRMGTLEIRRATDSVQRPATTLAADEKELHTAAFVLGDANRFSLMMAMSFDQKLAFLSRLLDPRSPLPQGTRRFKAARMLIEAIHAELAAEQVALRDGGGWNRGLAEKEAERKLAKLGALSRFETTVDPASREGALVATLGGGVEFMVRSQRMFRDQILPNRRNANITIVSNRLIERMLDSFYGPRKRTLLGRELNPRAVPGRAAVEEVARAYERTLHAQAKAEKKFYPELSLGAFLAPLGANGTGDGGDTLATRVMSAADLSQAAMEDDQREREQSELEAGNREAIRQSSLAPEGKAAASRKPAAKPVGKPGAKPASGRVQARR